MTEDEEYQEFLSMAVTIGFLLLTWSKIERQIDNWCYCAFHKCDGEKLAKNDAIPKMFTKKKEYLTKCFKQLPMLSEFKDEGLVFLDDALQLSLKKNNFTHGTLDDMTPVNGTYHFHRIHHNAKNYRVEQFTFAPRVEWPNLEKSLLALLGETAHFSDRLAKKFLAKPK